MNNFWKVIIDDSKTQDIAKKDSLKYMTPISHHTSPKLVISMVLRTLPTSLNIVTNDYKYIFLFLSPLIM